MYTDGRDQMIAIFAADDTHHLSVMLDEAVHVLRENHVPETLAHFGLKRQLIMDELHDRALGNDQLPERDDLPEVDEDEEG